MKGSRSQNIPALIVAAMLLAACAPEPTTPATTDLGGVWTSSAHVFSFSNLKMTIVQEPKGIVSGGWTATEDGGNGGCRPKISCDAFGDLIGQNLVSQVALELFGAGRFEGALTEPTKLQGILLVTAGNDTITFFRTGK